MLIILKVLRGNELTRVILMFTQRALESHMYAVYGMLYSPKLM